MPLTPSQILSVNRGGGAGTSLPIASGFTRAQDQIAAALADDTEIKNDDSFFDNIKEGVGNAVGAIGSTLDMGRAGLVAGAVEIGDLLRSAAGKEGFGPSGGASLDDLRYNFNRRIGVGDVLEENAATQGLPMNVKRGVAFVGDTAIDPLNAVGGGTSAAARQGIKKVGQEGGEDVGRLLAREGEGAADALLARQAADSAAARIGPAPLTNEERLAQVASNRSKREAGTLTAPVPAAEEVLAPKTVRSILAGRGMSDDAIDKTLSEISKTGAGGIRASLLPGSTKTLISGETLSKLPGAQAKRTGVDWLKRSGAGRAAREALVPLTRSRDKFTDAVAEYLPSIAHERNHYIASNVARLDSALTPVYKSVSAAERGQILSALDVSGLDVVATRTALEAEGLDDAVRALDVMVSARDNAYDELIRAGTPETDLMAKDEYLRHSLTDEGMEALGIDPSLRRGQSPSGTLKKRVREGGVTEQNAEFGFDAYKSDPAELVAASFEHAYTVGGNKMVYERLRDLGEQAGKDLTRKAPATGFTKIAPDAYIADEIYNDIINLRKAGADNSIVQGWDAFTGILKRYTLFGPIAFGPYFMQNMATGVAMNAAEGVRAADYALNLKVMNAIKGAEEAAVKGFTDKTTDHFDDALRASLPDPDEYRLAKGLWDQGLIDPGKGTYDDLAVAAKAGDSKWKNLGTNKTVKINAFGEEMLRGSAFIKHVRSGLSPEEAASMVRKRHLDYSAVGKTAFERNAINRFIFFPTWLLRAPKAIIGAYMQKPGLAMAQMRLEQGTHWYDRERNDYGDPLGPRLSGPMSFLAGLGQGQLPTEGGEILNPMARALLDSDARGAEDIVPPLSQVGRVSDILSDPDKRNRYLASSAGVRTGVDYQGEYAVENLQARVAEREALGGTATPSQTLAMRAVDILGPEAAGMRTGDLVQLLVQEGGMSTDEIRRILSAPYKSAERAPLNNVNVDELLASGASREEIQRALVG